MQEKGRMAMNVLNGRFGLKCFESAPENGEAVEPAETEQSNDLSQLEEKAVSHLMAGRFRYIEIHQWNAAAAEWAIMRSLQVD